METRTLKILMIIEQCNPEWASVPLVAYNFYNHIRQHAQVTLVTHERNAGALEKIRGKDMIEYIKENTGIKWIYSFASKASTKNGVNWPLLHALSYPVYFNFNREVYKRYNNRIQSENFDIVHAITPINPRYPYSIVKSCINTPFIVGPVNGGVPFPSGFSNIAKKEFAHMNFLRFFSRLIPGYKKSYTGASNILVGSHYTGQLLQQMFNIERAKIIHFHENGILKEFIGKQKCIHTTKLQLLFVGRLVPYKGADMAIESIGRLNEKEKQTVHLTIIGDGPELENLKMLATTLNLQSIITFTGWIEHHATAAHYKTADAFLFPSIREFGGAVALEAMAAGLPCIVPDYAGLGEYVTEETGFKIEPISREHLISEMVVVIRKILTDPSLLKPMSEKAISRVNEFEWSEKAKRMISIYHEALRENKRLK